MEVVLQKPESNCNVNEYSDGSLIVNSIARYVNANGLALSNVDYVKATLSNGDILRTFSDF